MGKIKKSTRKFQQKHLKGEIARRKKFQAAKKRREAHQKPGRDEGALSEKGLKGACGCSITHGPRLLWESRMGKPVCSSCPWA